MAVEPLALWYPNGGSDFGTEVSVIDGFSSEDELEPSEWVRTMIKGFGSYVGFPVACCENQCIAFFQKLEKVWENQATVGSLRCNTSSTKKGTRELRNLVSSVNYEGQFGRQTRGIENFCRVGSVSCP